MLLGMASHVPGGAGVFEGLMVLLLKPHLSSAELVPVFIVYRAVYYLAPLSLALLGLVADELHQRREQAARVGAALGELTEQLTPRLLAVFAFLAGMVLLFSGATPAAAGRLTRLSRLFPIGVIEVSHFAGSVVGAALLLSVAGDQPPARCGVLPECRSRSSPASQPRSLKGFDYEEAMLLAFVLVLLWRARPAFTRRAAFFDTRFSAEWIAALASAVIASIWLGLFAFKHVDYSHELWWQFELHGEASRFLRASVGAAVVVLLFGIARLMRHAPHEFIEPTEADLAAAGAVIDAQTATTPNLVYLRDKSVLFSKDKKAFVMYGVQGRTWVAIGDPVGPPERMDEMIRLLLERCDDFGGTPVFYEVGAEHLHRYADLGLTFVKLGEEARVDLAAFTMTGGAASRLRQTLRRLEKDGARFRVVAAEDIPAVLPRLREISDEWLTAKAGAEKGFSLGFFDEAYVRRFPVASDRVPRTHSGLREPLARKRPQRALDRSDALRPRGAQERHGGAADPSDDLGKSRRIPMVRARHGPACRCGALSTRHAVEQDRRLPLRARRAHLRISGPARVQGEVQPGVGAAISRVSRWSQASTHPRRHRRAHRRRLSTGVPAIARRREDGSRVDLAASRWG